jgi:nucleotide-binding universal stress UspA family protein
MHSALIAVDGSAWGEGAVREIVREARRGRIDNIHLLAVQPALNGHIGHFVGGRAIRDYQRAEGEKALAGARRILDNAGLAYSAHIRVGEPARAILMAAKELRVDEIVTSADSDGLLDHLLQRLLIGRLIRRATIPVRVVRRAPPEQQPAPSWPWSRFSH